MNQILFGQAAKLACRPYRHEIRLDQATTGEPIYFATCLDLEGCNAQGETMEEALENLILARQDYIYSLLEDNLPVPAPTPISTNTSGVNSWQMIVIHEKQHATIAVNQLASAD